LPVDTEYPSFLSAVQSVANVSGIGLTSWTPQPEVSEQFYARVPMKVTLVGRYHQVAKFFYGVGQLDRIINMENISLTDPKVQGDDVVVKTEALATAFRTVEDAKATSADKRGAAMGAPK
jgi:type IV pilus assembly protein PilO